MKILVTGGTGFLGSCLTRELSKENDIVIMARGEKKSYLHNNEMKEFNFIKCDMRDKYSLEKILPDQIDLVIHCAGAIDIKEVNGDIGGLIESNLSTTINLIESMIKKGIPRLIFSSSMTVYGINNAAPVSENDILDPIHFYGLSKKWSEEVIIKYAVRKFIKAAILRYPGLYGYPRDSGYIYNIIKKMLKHEGIFIDTTDLKFWECISISDACSITHDFIRAWNWKLDFSVVNCSYGEELDFIKTAFKIKDLIKSKSRIVVKEPVDYIKFFLDNSRIRSMIDFNYSFDKGMNSFLDKYRNWLAK